LEEYLRETELGVEICRTVTAEDIDRLLVTGIVFFAMLYEAFCGAYALKRDKWIEDFMMKFKEKRG
jgi:hypothetical protein